MGIKMEKIFVIIFFVCLFISSITFLAYDFVSEEIKKLIIWINVVFFDFNHSNDDLSKIKKMIRTL